MTPWVRLLLGLNIGAFFLQMTAPQVMDLFVFVPRLTHLRPWSIVTYMFLHGGFSHILWNMLGLFFFGPRVEARLGSNRFAILYFVSGITGALFSLFLAPNSPIIGASAGLYGVMLAFAYWWPNETILLWMIVPIPARLLVVLTTLITLWSGFGGISDGVAHFAHLGGYVGAFMYLRWLERGRGEFKKRTAVPAATVAKRLAKRPKIDLTNVHELNKTEVNRLLDKISEKGIASLTPQERTFLSNFVPPDDRPKIN